jgi:hypothetical protein
VTRGEQKGGEKESYERVRAQGAEDSSQGESRERRRRERLRRINPHLPGHAEWHSSQGESRERQGREDKKKNRY